MFEALQAVLFLAGVAVAVMSVLGMTVVPLLQFRDHLRDQKGKGR